jgi:hypothetical protein
MRLALSSQVAPRLPLESLLEGCRRRGLAGLELVAGGAHGVDVAGAAQARRTANDAGIALTGVRCEADADAAAALALAEALRAPLVLRVDGRPVFRLVRLIRRAVARQVRVLLLHGAEPRLVARLRRAVEALPAGTAGLAWEVDPSRDDPAAVPEVLRVAGRALEAVILRGGGPESAAQTGLGVGALMARLTLARYGGPLVLAPGAAGSARAWSTWLGRRGGWGCGSRSQDPDLVTLSMAGT